MARMPRLGAVGLAAALIAACQAATPLQPPTIVRAGGDRQARAVVGAVIAMADALDLEVVGEGVERESQADVLVELGADQAQGHLFGAAKELPDSVA